jgi:hypothetical protein
MRQHASKAIKRPRLRRQRPIRSRRHHAICHCNKSLPPNSACDPKSSFPFVSTTFHCVAAMKTSEATPAARTNHAHVKPVAGLEYRFGARQQRPRDVNRVLSRTGHTGPRSTAPANISRHSINRCISATKLSFNVRATLVPSGTAIHARASLFQKSGAWRCPIKQRR